MESGAESTTLHLSSQNKVPVCGTLNSDFHLKILLKYIQTFGEKLRFLHLSVDVIVGSEGLGFTVVTRDSSIHGPGPILVKNILPRGAAVKDGRLQSGDRILEV